MLYEHEFTYVHGNVVIRELIEYFQSDLKYLNNKMEVMSIESTVSKYDMETDISKLEAPTFTTIDRSNPASMVSLDWDHQVNLVGKKVLNPMIHSCDKCLKPILIYGRMIPCKHVFCLGCAKAETKTCPR